MLGRVRPIDGGSVLGEVAKSSKCVVEPASDEFGWQGLSFGDLIDGPSGTVGVGENHSLLRRQVPDGVEEASPRLQRIASVPAGHRPGARSAV
jgi:hypothetical protein